MTKILISIVGIGLGHATRCEAVANALREAGAEILIATYGPAYKYFKERGYPVEKFSGQEYGGEKFTFNIMLNIFKTFKEPDKFRKDYFEFREIADKFKPDIIFSDSEPNAFFYAYRRKIPNFVLSNVVTTVNNSGVIPIFMRRRAVYLQEFMLKQLISFMLKRTDLFLVPTFESKVKYGDRVKYTDLIVRKKPEELRPDSELRDQIGIYKDFYYVSIGGSDIEKYLFHFLEKTLPEYKDKFFVISSNYVLKKKVEKANMVIYPFIENVFDFLKLCRGVITTAGHSTLSEAIVYKKPVLAIPVRKHVEQLVNAMLIKREGFGEPCFFETEVSEKRLKQALDNFFKNEEVFRQNLAKRTFTGDGARQIAKIILG
jgi:uncharacterized protein (TIGR00661 family)